mgnify:CR=1 FL=1
MKVEDERLMDISPTQIRIPTALKKRIISSAKSRNETISSEIVHRLEESYANDTNEKLAKLEEKLDEVLRRLGDK